MVDTRCICMHVRTHTHIYKPIHTVMYVYDTRIQYTCVLFYPCCPHRFHNPPTPTLATHLPRPHRVAPDPHAPCRSASSCGGGKAGSGGSDSVDSAFRSQNRLSRETRDRAGPGACSAPRGPFTEAQKHCRHPRSPRRRLAACAPMGGALRIHRGFPHGGCLSETPGPELHEALGSWSLRCSEPSSRPGTIAQSSRRARRRNHHY